MSIPLPYTQIVRDAEKPFTESTRRARRLSTRRKVAFSMVALTLGCLMAEGLVYAYLRFQGFHWGTARQARLETEIPRDCIPNDRYIWSFEPDSAYTFTDPRDNETCHVQLNSKGFRDEEAEERHGAEFQFVALGDSFTFGWLVEKADRWDEVLARSIHRKHGTNAASVNLGMWMTTFDQHTLILEDHLPTKCDAVIHFVYPSHLQTINRHVATMKDGEIQSVYDPLLHIKDNTLFYGAADSSLIERKLTVPFSLCLWRFQRNVRDLQEKVRHTTTVPEMTDEQIYRRSSQDLFRRGYELTEKSISQTASMLKARDIPYVVVLIPRDLQLSEQEWNSSEPDSEILTTAIPQQRIREMCEATGHAVCLDLLPVMRRNYHAKLYHPQDPHWRPEGHELAASAVQDLLERLAIIGDASH